MVTACSTREVLDRATASVNASLAASQAWIDRYIEAAEGVVVSETGIVTGKQVI